MAGSAACPPGRYLAAASHFSTTLAGMRPHGVMPHGAVLPELVFGLLEFTGRWMGKSALERLAVLFCYLGAGTYALNGHPSYMGPVAGMHSVRRRHPGPRVHLGPDRRPARRGDGLLNPVAADLSSAQAEAESFDLAGCQPRGASRYRCGWSSRTCCCGAAATADNRPLREL